MGGGGDGGFGARQDAQDAAKAEARRQLNLLFGHYAGAPVDRAQFEQPGGRVQIGESEAGPIYAEAPAGFDQAGYDAALATEAERRAEAERNRAGLETLFGQTRTNAFDAGRRRLEEERERAARDLRFELFARGTAGGSVDIDQNALLGRTFSQGLTDLGGKADSVATQLRGDNEAARLQLLQSIDSGMDAGSAVSSALGQMRVNADRAAADAIGTNVGDLFSTTGLIYNQNRVAQGRQNAGNWWAQNAGRSTPSSSGGARSGRLSFAG